MSDSAIASVAKRAGIPAEYLRSFGPDIVKVAPAFLGHAAERATAPKLILVSAITPTPAGEGKTTTSIGLGQGLARLGERACLALREPSLGPAFGRKGGATGTGLCQLVPADRINLHFTGDFHAVSSAHNLLAAMVDNHLHFRLEPELVAQRVVWPRVLDVNDRALRQVIVGLGGPGNGVPRESRFEITAASEVMAALCLAEGAQDLRQRLSQLIVGYGRDGAPVTAGDLRAVGAMLALLRDAVWPNLVATTEGVPAFVHGGPFANIAHGCSSVLGTRMALRCGDWAITEAGFGFDLGAEKFFDIKCRAAGLDTAAVVLVATLRALKYHGGVALDRLSEIDARAVERGLPNLDKHIENIRAFGEVPIVALNQFTTDSREEIELVAAHCARRGVPFAASDHVAKGGAGAEGLARTVIDHAERTSVPFRPLYELSAPAEDKIRIVAQTLYGARNVVYTRAARRALERARRLGFGSLPVCIAKTQQSLSDDPGLRGRPSGFEVTVREVHINAGAGFLVIVTGEVLRMPGLPKSPRAQAIDLEGDALIGLS